MCRSLQHASQFEILKSLPADLWVQEFGRLNFWYDILGVTVRCGAAAANQLHRECMCELTYVLQLHWTNMLFQSDTAYVCPLPLGLQCCSSYLSQFGLVAWLNPWLCNVWYLCLRSSVNYLHARQAGLRVEANMTLLQHQVMGELHRVRRDNAVFWNDNIALNAHNPSTAWSLTFRFGTLRHHCRCQLMMWPGLMYTCTACQTPIIGYTA